MNEDMGKHGIVHSVREQFKTVKHKADVCVVGAGLAGMCAAIAAARRGCSVVLVHDRPMPGGNCSSEIRMWPLGADGSNPANLRETGIFEELLLENMYRNPTRSFAIWDSVLYGAVKYQSGLKLILNCSVNAARTHGARIVSVSGWQLTTYLNHEIEANIFIDCSGDSVLATLSGAKFRRGREAAGEFGESIEPETADSMTMGNTCLIQARETAQDIRYTPARWAEKIDKSQLEGRGFKPSGLDGNYWWMELGGERDTISDSEEIRDELIALSYGVWDYVKNSGDGDASRWELDWAGYLPGKRESRRYVGDYILTQNDAQNGTRFYDVVAYGGRSIDDHPPLGFRHRGKPTVYHKCAAPFSIPYRCLYSENVQNLMFAGRNISVTHAAMAASRVMATCAILGQAAGTAAWVAAQNKTDPRGVLDSIELLQQTLMYDDCWLPGLSRKISGICQNARLTADCENADILRNGLDRPENGDDNGCFLPLGGSARYVLEKRCHVRALRIVFDSDLLRETIKKDYNAGSVTPTVCNRPLEGMSFEFPPTMTREFEIYIDGELFLRVNENYKRLVVIPVGRAVSEIEMRPLATYGRQSAHVFSFDFE